ncbi:hypothetical protein ACFVT5_00445 [Streptomyces sp. NPDC058001]|uniref:hypothetical protein n=1 Tax=Streptomyces sp. NPDC058001 TaxID=3346300 RepID=UPI0036E3D17F
MRTGMRTRETGHRRAAVGIGAAVCLSVVLGGAVPAYAGSERNEGDSGSTQPPNRGGESGDGTIGAHINLNRHAPGGGTKTTPVRPINPNWKPPVCWYEPEYTPEEYEKFIKDAYNGAQEPAASYAKKRDGEKYHKGDDGLWWKVAFRNDTYQEACPISTDNWEIWVPPADPQPDPNKITPEKLSELAYNATELPAPPVRLKPGADRLVVNLGTRVAFEGDFDRVWTTASINYKGVQMAATTVATPVALKVEAGTDDADPQTCTYDLTKGKGGYQVNSEDAGCNVTYRRSSGSGTYPFKASITWKVTWTDSANPDGPAQQPGLPDGLSTYEQDVAVKEIQSVNR